MSGFERVGRVEDIPLLEARAVTIGGRRVAVVRLLDGFAAVDADCPHAGGPIADGLVADACVTCPLHGWRFDLRTGAPAGGGATAGIAVHEVVERGGELWVRTATDSLEAA